MNHQPYILGIIPARGGSKGIPKKNIKILYDRPLIAWTIDAAKKSRLLNRFIVSTDDAEIADVSRKYGAEVIPRPAELATDEATTLSVLQHVLSLINADIVVLLQCTSPVRDDDLIDRCITKYLKSGADSVATGHISKLYEWGNYEGRRQDMDGFFHDDGNVYVLNTEILKNGDLFGKKMVPFIISQEQNFEIDDEFEFWLNEQIIRKRMEKL